MKKLLLLLLLSITAIAQDSTKNFSRFQIGLSIMPEMDLIDFDKNFDYKPTLNHSLGVNLNYNLSRILSLETGLHYYNNTDRIEKTIVNLAQPDPVFDADFYKFRNSERSLRIPIKANFILGKRKLKFIASAGVLTHYWLNYSSKTTKYYSDKTVETRYKTSQTPFKRIIFSPITSLGADYKVNEKVNIRIEPTLWRRSFNFKNSIPFSFTYMTGINFGMYCSL